MPLWCLDTRRELDANVCVALLGLALCQGKEDIGYGNTHLFVHFQAIAPLLENNHPPPDLCEFFCKVRPFAALDVSLARFMCNLLTRAAVCCSTVGSGRGQWS